MRRAKNHHQPNFFPSQILIDDADCEINGIKNSVWGRDRGEKFILLNEKIINELIKYVTSHDGVVLKSYN